MTYGKTVRPYLVQMKQNCFPWEESVKTIMKCGAL